MRTLSLRRMESHIWRTYQQDGLTDVLFGLLLLSAAVIGVLDHLEVPSGIRLFLTVALPGLGLGLVFWLRKRFVAPRLGCVRFSPRRSRSVRWMRIFMAACVLITVTLVVLTALSNRLGLYFPGDLGALGVWGVVAAVILVPVGMIALVLDYPRLLVHAMLFVTVEFLHIVVRLPSLIPYGGPIAYAAAASISLTIGLTVYARFLHRLKRIEEPEHVRIEGADDEIA